MNRIGVIMNIQNQNIQISPSAAADAHSSPVPGETVPIWISETERAPTRIKSVHVNAFDVVCFIHRRAEKTNDEIGHIDEKRGILVNGKPTCAGRG